MMVTVSGWSGETNAYVSVLSATGSWLIAGASRCDDIGSSWLVRSPIRAPRLVGSLGLAPLGIHGTGFPIRTLRAFRPARGVGGKRRTRRFGRRECAETR